MIDRRKRPLNRRPSSFRDSFLIVICTEGRRSEKVYFENFSSSRLHIEVIEAIDDRSDPESVLARADEFVEKYKIDENDYIFLAIDRDRWAMKSLAHVNRECRRKNYNICMSNPCFEVWLLFHFSDFDTSGLKSKSISKKLSEHIAGYKKNKFLIPDLIARSKLAANRARERDTTPDNPFPNDPGSRIYKIVDLIFETTDRFK